MSAASGSTSEFSPRAWKDFLFDVMPRQGAWTEEQYLAMTDHTNRLIEFTDGRLEPLLMPTDRHQAARRHGPLRPVAAANPTWKTS